MTVADLMRELERFPPDLVVLTETAGHQQPTLIELVSADPEDGPPQDLLWLRGADPDLVPSTKPARGSRRRRAGAHRRP